MNSYKEIFEKIKLANLNKSVDNINSRVLIVDGMNTFIRSYIKSPQMNQNGTHIGGISAFLKSIGYGIRMVNATRCIIVFDGKGGSVRRKKLYPNYKNKNHMTMNFNRAYDFKSNDEELNNMAREFARLYEYLIKLPVSIITIDNIEADDTIAYLCTNILNKTDNHKYIMSADKDFLQLVNDDVTVYSPTKKILYTPDKVYSEYGIDSRNFVLYRILDGDKSDCIGKIKGAGLITIKKQIPMMTEIKKIEYSDFINYFETLEDVKSKVIKTIKENLDVLELNYKLMQLNDVDISLNAKLKIVDLTNKIPDKLNKFDFEVMAIKDGLAIELENIADWINKTFRYVNSFIV